VFGIVSAFGGFSFSKSSSSKELDSLLDLVEIARNSSKSSSSSENSPLPLPNISGNDVKKSFPLSACEICDSSSLMLPITLDFVGDLIVGGDIGKSKITSSSAASSSVFNLISFVCEKSEVPPELSLGELRGVTCITCLSSGTSSGFSGIIS